jgi:hypothetical protein
MTDKRLRVMLDITDVWLEVDSAEARYNAFRRDRLRLVLSGEASIAPGFGNWFFGAALRQSIDALFWANSADNRQALFWGAWLNPVNGERVTIQTEPEYE